MILGAVTQQPADLIDYDFEFSEWFDNNEDFIESVTTNIKPAPLTLNVAANTSGQSKVKMWVQGGEDGDEFTVEITITTFSGRTKQFELIVIIKDY